MTGLFVDRLTPILVEGDLEAAWELLDSLDGEQLKHAKDWFAGSRRWLARLHELTFAGDDHDARWRASRRAEWIVAMCAVRLCGPVTAAKRVPWNNLWTLREDPGEAAFIHLLWDTAPAWVAEFVEAASHVSLGGNAPSTNGQLSRALRAAVVHHGLPCPRGRTFLACWWAGTDQNGSLADRLAVDPLMPDLLSLYLSSGHCGDLPQLPEAVAELCATGRVDRESLLGHVLELLTTSQRPKSQKVLAQITAALQLRPAEIPGGLTYLLGVLATSYREVVPLMLPSAIALVADADGLLQLTTVLAARPERGPKETLLKALKQPEPAATVGTAAVRDSLAMLGAGDDARFTDRVKRHVATLSSTPDHANATPPPRAVPVMGLWDLLPSNNGEGHGRRRPYRDPTWAAVLDRNSAHRAALQPWLVDVTLEAMVAGTFRDGELLRAAAHSLLSRQRLVLSALARALEDLFLAGGLRQAWPVALDVADAACSAPSRPAGIADLLRTLSRYAVEVPRPWEVPPHIAELVAAEGHTKAQAEARKFAALLADTDLDAVVARCRQARPAPALPRRRGLWEAPPPPLGRLPSLRRLPASEADPGVERTSGLQRLRQRLSEDYNGCAQSYEDVCFRPPGYTAETSSTSLTNPDRVLAAVVSAVGRYGADSVRRALAGIDRRYKPVDVVAAIDVWAAGALDLAGFWRVAHGPSVSQGALREMWFAAGVSPREANARMGALPPLSQQLSQPDHPDVDALVLPDELAAAAEQLAFLRSAEALMRADRHPTILSTPTWADGTLDLDDLLSRLALVAAGSDPTVGPIDLVQALHRLRPVDRARLDDVPAGLRTDPDYTDRRGLASWDATEMVRIWIAEGGLPSLNPAADEAGRWTTTAVAPVPFNRLVALPRALADDPWTPGPLVSVVRMMPRWGDRVVENAFAEVMLDDPRHFPGHIAGPLGVPLHDRLLSLLTPGLNTDRFGALPVLAEVAQQGRLDPAAAAAAAVGRHHQGTLRLGVLVKVLQRGLEERGAFADLWPCALAIANALCAVARKPSGLPDLLRLLTKFAHEVPASAAADVPDALRRLADSRGSTKSHDEARALVDALNRTRGGVR